MFLATVFIILITLLNIIVYYLRKHYEEGFDERSHSSSSPSSDHLCRRFSLAEIKSATNNFDEALVVGKGGFGKVYRGTINNPESTVAIKRLDLCSKQGAPEFWTEIEMLSKFKHSHLVSLIGYCDDYQEMIIVYEYMSAGSLRDHLHKIGGSHCKPFNLSWLQRLKICIGAARGLDYLHTGTGIQQRVIHRDVKSSNILLDENWAAKISDFGLSKIGPANQDFTHVSTHVKGTFGYLDPEYYLTRRVTRKSDVYAFGVVLLELLCGRPALDSKLDVEQQSLARWAKNCIKEGKLDQMIDSSLTGQILPTCLKEFAQVANQCLHNQPKKRPTMAEVVVRLESALSSQEITDFSFLEGQIIDGASENMDSFTEHELVSPSDGGEHQEMPSDGYTRLGGARRAQRSTFIRKALSLFSDENFSVTRWKRRMPRKPTDFPRDLFMDDISASESLQYNFSTICAATDDFSENNKLGGGFDAVYKGSLKNGLQIAVKRLPRHFSQGAHEFKNEVLFGAKLQHRNLVRLLGFCLEGKERLLIYEFAHNGSLDRFLFGSAKRRNLDWNRRSKIIEGVARGVLYLHEDSRLKIIHRDLKASNVLLDAEMNAKIGDFSLAMLVYPEETQGNTNQIVGTFGYMAPEYAMRGQFSVKSDVYSFGVLVLEIISGRKNYFQNEESYENLQSYVWKSMQDGTATHTIDPILREGSGGSIRDMLRCLHIGLLCVQDRAADRPTMASIIQMLSNQSIILPEPAFFMHSGIDPGMPPLNSGSFSGSSQCSVIEESITDIIPG